jgi:uncharacterized membrane protein YphA (DoxX/SURF4 family)
VERAKPVIRAIKLAATPSAAAAATARIVLCLPFWWSGLSKLLDFSRGTAQMAVSG